MDGIPLGNVDLEMDMVFSKAEFAELKTKTFQVPKRLNAGVYVALFSKISVSVVGGKHHCQPVITGVTRNLFRATAIYNIHNRFFLSHQYRAGRCLPRATKNRYSLIGEKMDATFHLRVLRYRFRPRSIRSRSYI